jgi:hexosaminidase
MTGAKGPERGIIMDRLTTNDTAVAALLEPLKAWVPIYLQQNFRIRAIKDEGMGESKNGWQKDGREIAVYWDRPAGFYAALGRALAHDGDGREALTPAFERVEAMVDLSRNAVYTLAEMKRFLCRLALMGYTGCQMYMEDTYELPGYPYWGYMRGRYSTKELKELDDFAAGLGLELVPCIQTLAHLRTALRWNYIQPMRDTPDILMVGSEETEELLDAVLGHLSRTFRSRRIHVGMDEAVELGAGRYRQKYGYASHRELMKRHLETVCRLCTKYGLEPMMWDDMLFRDDTPAMEYYCDSAPVTPKQKAEYPKNLQFVYWDYYHGDDEAHYSRQIKRRGCLDVVFAGGVWKWGGWVPNHTVSFGNVSASLAACKKHGVKTVFATLWGDDGAETPLDTTLPGLAYFGMLCYGDARPEETDGFCQLLSGTAFEDYMLMERFDDRPGTLCGNVESLTPHKLILYGDMASDLFVPSFSNTVKELEAHYRGLIPLLQAARERSEDSRMKAVFKMYEALADVLARKLQIHGMLRPAYESGGREQIAGVMERMQGFEEAVSQLHRLTVPVWGQACKGQGLEVMDLRLGGLIARCQSLRMRMQAYLDGELDCLSELEDELLPYAGNLARDGRTPGRESYGNIVTVNTL